MQTLVGSASRPDGGGGTHRDRSPADRSGDPAPSFGGVLADVKADGRRAALDGKLGAKAADQTSGPPFEQADAAAGTDDDRFLDELLAAAHPDQPAGDKSGEPDTSSLMREPGDPVERKDETANQADSEDISTASAPPLDLLSMLLAGRNGVPPAAAGTATAPGVQAAPETTAAMAKTGAALFANAAATPPMPGGPGAPDVADLPPAKTGDPNQTAPAATVQTATIISAAPTFETHLSPARPIPDHSASPDASAEPGATKDPQKPASTIEPTAIKPTAAAEKDADVSLAPRHDSAPITPAPLGVSSAAPTLRAISGAIVELASRAASPAAEQPAQSVTPMARSMVLQLSPADLGTVDIRMHVSGDTLDVELTLSDTRAYGLVSRERDDLAAALHDTNYSLHSLVIQESGSAASSGGFDGNSAQSQGGGEPRSDRSAGGGDAGQRDRGGGQDRGRAPFEQAAAREATSASSDRSRPADRRAGSVFV